MKNKILGHTKLWLALRDLSMGLLGLVFFLSFSNIAYTDPDPKLVSKYKDKLGNFSELYFKKADQLSLLDMEALAEALKDNNTLKVLKIEDFAGGIEAARFIANALKINKNLESLSFISEPSTNLESEKLVFADALVVNDTLKYLILRNDGQNYKDIGDRLERNRKLPVLLEKLFTLSPESVREKKEWDTLFPGVKYQLLQNLIRDLSGK